jgi:hypothetical protein
MSIIEFDRIIPVNPPIVNISKNPIDHIIIGELFLNPLIVINHEKILIPVGIAIIIVVVIKYVCVSISKPIVNIWCLHTINPISLIVNIAKIMLIFLKFFILLVSWFIICDIIPKPGKIRIYTSGCPKNQNKCWNIIGLPFPFGLKNIVLKLISEIIIVIALAKTGKEIINKIEVIIIDQQNKFKLNIFKYMGFR